MCAFFSLEEIGRQRQWKADIRNGVLHIFGTYLGELEPPADGSPSLLSPDAMLWVIETFFCRAAQDGTAAALSGDAVQRVVENYAVKSVRGAMLDFLASDLPLLAAKVHSLASAAAASSDAPGAVEHAIQEACRQFALVVAQLRIKVGESVAKVYPADPFIFLHAISPLDELVRRQAEVRREWAGEMGFGDCWGRAHAGDLKSVPRLSRTVGGKVDEESAVSQVSACEHLDQTEMSLKVRLQVMTASEAAEAFIAANPLVGRSYAGTTGDGDNKPWCPKSRQQFRSAARLATKYLGATPLAQATQMHFVPFYLKLMELPANHHTKIGDEARSLDEIIKRASDEADGNAFERIGPSTARRHLNNVRNLCAWMSDYLFLPVVNWEDVISWRGRNGSNNDLLTIEEVTLIFSLPVWTGAKQHFGTPEAGEHVWHGAAYWVPLFLWYSGVARDALCASEVVDVVEVDGIWCLRVLMEREGLSSGQGFDRDVPLHPELLRLGFLKYVDALKSVGEPKLFPDLRRASDQSPADIFSSRYWRNIRQASPWLPKECAVGAIRQASQQALQDLGAPNEKTLDLFGIRGSSEADLRYTRVTPPAYLQRVVALIPVTTAHIERRSIKLVPRWARMSTPARTVPRVHQRRYQEQKLKGLFEEGRVNPRWPLLPPPK